MNDDAQMQRIGNLMLRTDRMWRTLYVEEADPEGRLFWCRIVSWRGSAEGMDTTGGYEPGLVLLAAAAGFAPQAR